MDFLRLPFFDHLAPAERILVAGAGGGFDVFTGLPLYFGLRRMGKQVHLANLSFANIGASTGRKLTPALVEVTAETTGSEYYFPELFLAHWFHQRGEAVPIYCFENTGVVPIREGYEKLVKDLDLDTIILVDGGTDSLMRGDEAGLGTPHEDLASLAAVSQLQVPRKLITCIGFGVDTFHGVCHAQFLESVAAITQSGGFLGMWSLMQDMPEVQLYQEAATFVFLQMPHHPSIVSSSILSAIEGHFGDYHATYRTQSSYLFINPLMTLLWCFRLDAVVQRLLYSEELFETQTRHDIGRVIAECRNQYPPRRWADLPM
ncbi:MAG: DUF1152 domain-containing protein [Abitibacteriaceae bacterium]|nr:DUF1152 domain-containing protein [Abditibacteriaceae bacterium]